MSSRIRRPESVRLFITQGDWLEVKRHLSAGEQRRIYTRMIKTMVAGESTTLDPEQAGLSQMIEYLLDWSITDPDGKLVPVRDQPPDKVAAGILALDVESYNEIREAIQTHDAAMVEERVKEKNGQAGVSAPPAIFESVA